VNHLKHSYLMIGFLVVGATLFFTGTVSGGVLFLLWPLACLGMMVLMMGSMTRMQRRADHTHDDADRTTHSHR